MRAAFRRKQIKLKRGDDDVLGWRGHWTDPPDPADPAAYLKIRGCTNRRAPLPEEPSPCSRIDEGPSEEGPSLLPDSLTARASFTHGFPHYPYPNLPMTLRSVVNRCTNSEQILRADRVRGQWLAIKESFTFQSGRRGPRPAPEATQEAAGRPASTIVSMITASNGTLVGSPLVGTCPMASTTSAPATTVPSRL
jgi:hypothetical protein